MATSTHGSTACEGTPDALDSTHGDHTGALGRVPWAGHVRARLRGAAWGTVAGAALLLVYVLVLALANSLEHALDEAARLWPWMLLIVGGFAAQVGLFAYVRAATRWHEAGDARGVVVSGSASTASMIACCAHHLTDVLPLIGLAGAAVFLVRYQSLFLLLGVLSNLAGLVYVLGIVRRHRLFPDRPSMLGRAVSWPVDRAVPWAIAGSALVFATVTVLTLT